jgi:hypothetical protein
MTLWQRFIRLFDKKESDVADKDSWYDPRAPKDCLDARARDAARIADARLPPHSANFPF